MVAIVNKILAISTVISHITLVLGFLYFFTFGRESKDKVIKFLGKHALKFAFFFALLAMASSLFYSDVVGYTPCILCWYQRIFMYPQVFILGLAIFKRDAKVIPYASLLAWLGLIVSLYHNYIYLGGKEAFNCEAFGLGTSCTQRYVFEFGYVTIPLMALTTFVLILTFFQLHKIYLLRQEVITLKK